MEECREVIESNYQDIDLEEVDYEIKIPTQQEVDNLESAAKKIGFRGAYHIIRKTRELLLESNEKAMQFLKTVDDLLEMNGLKDGEAVYTARFLATFEFNDPRIAIYKIKVTYPTPHEIYENRLAIMDYDKYMEEIKEVCERLGYPSAGKLIKSLKGEKTARKIHNILQQEVEKGSEMSERAILKIREWCRMASDKAFFHDNNIKPPQRPEMIPTAVEAAVNISNPDAVTYIATDATVCVVINEKGQQKLLPIPWLKFGQDDSKVPIGRSTRL